jgi:hypothetical protein
MMTLIAAAALAAQAPAAPAPADPLAQHARHQQDPSGEHKDCCKDCCKDMAAMHEGHSERGGHGAD